VIGATQLSGPVLDNLRGQVTALQEDKRELEDTTQGLQTQVDTGRPSTAVAPRWCRPAAPGAASCCWWVTRTSHRRPSRRSAPLAAPAARSPAITAAAGYSDPAAAALQSYVTAPACPPGVELPETDDTGQLVGLAAGPVLMIPPRGPSPPTPRVSSVLAGLQALDVLSGTRLGQPRRLRRRPHRGGYASEDARDRTGSPSTWSAPWTPRARRRRGRRRRLGGESGWSARSAPTRRRRGGVDRGLTSDCGVRPDQHGVALGRESEGTSAPTARVRTPSRCRRSPHHPP
jgi:hypothetical protein